MHKSNTPEEEVVFIHAQTFLLLWEQHQLGIHSNEEGHT